MVKDSELTPGDCENMMAFIGHVLDDYKAGRIDKLRAASGLAHVMKALDQDNYAQARGFLRQGRGILNSNIAIE